MIYSMIYVDIAIIGIWLYSLDIHSSIYVSKVNSIMKEKTSQLYILYI